MNRWTSYFSEPFSGPPEALKSELGGKGASLKEMTLAGLSVPPGFTIRTACCQEYFAAGRRWPDGLADEVRQQLTRLERETGRRFGCGPRPLLVSVRSGAALSMPGMMDTLLNCGLTLPLGDELGGPTWYWALYQQFVVRFAQIVHGIDEETLLDGQSAAATRESCVALRQRLVRQSGEGFADEPWQWLVRCIDAVFASWHSPRADAYRQRHGITGLPGTAVNVQAMFPSQVSGVLFTRDPTGAHENRMVIEASYGLGESVVSGEVTPDRFLVDRGDGRRIETQVGRKHTAVVAFGEPLSRGADEPSLEPAQVGELYELGLRIEKFFGKPMDIEWGLADGRFALLQSRPIRGLEAAAERQAAQREEQARLRALADGRRRVWVVHNLGETLPQPTPLTWDIVRQFMSGAGGFGRLYRDLGYRPSQRVCTEGFLELIAGRIYSDPERQAELFWDHMPLTYDLDAVAADHAVLDGAPSKFDASKANGLFLARLPGTLWAMWRASRLVRRARASAVERFEKQALPPFLEFVKRAGDVNLAKLGDAELLRLLNERRRVVLDEFGPESLRPGFFGGLAYGGLEGLLVQLMGKAAGGELARTLTSALDGDITFEQDRLLFDVAQGRATLSDFLDRFGHRATGEMELATPRWREEPKYLENLVKQHQNPQARDPLTIHHRSAERRKAAEAELPNVLREWGGSSLQAGLEADLRDAQRLLPYRESGKYYLMQGYETLRAITQELGQRWDLGENVYFLRLAELAGMPAAGPRLAGEIERRRRRWAALKQVYVGDVIDSKDLDRFGEAPAVDGADEYSGTPLAPGLAAGPVRLVTDPQEVGDLGMGYVLVCGSTDPGWTPLFMNAAALVVERGGVLSHGAIVARDFGIPAVACPGATQWLKEGQKVWIDGNRGRVTLHAQEVANHV